MGVLSHSGWSCFLLGGLDSWWVVLFLVGWSCFLLGGLVSWWVG